MKRQISRRTFLHTAVGAAAAPAVLKLAGCHDPDAAWRDVDLAQGAHFPSGVIAGSPTPQGITLLAPVEGAVGTPRLGIDIAEDPALERIVFRTTVDLPADPAVPVQITLENPALRPGTSYFYRFFSHGSPSGIGRFTTLRPETDASPSRMGFFSCQGWQAGYYPAHAGLAAEPNLDLVLSLGDYIYEWTDDTGPDDRLDRIGDGQAGFAQTIAEYRAKYRLYRSDLDLQAMHAAQTFLAVWDGHDLGNPPGTGMPPPRFTWEERKENGRNVFWEQMPMRRGPETAVLYRSLRIGANLELFLLDLYSYSEAPGKDAFYLGDTQLAWLLDGLSSSTARWKVIASSAVMMNIELVAGTPLNVEQWDGYPGERRRLIEGILKRGVKDVVVVSGDLHTFLASPVSATGRSDSVAGLVEFCGGAITSQGLLNLVPEDGEFARRLEREAQTLNPHISFINILDRGYGLLEARPDELIVTFRSPKTVYEQKSPVRDLASFRVRSGNPAVEIIAVDPGENTP